MDAETVSGTTTTTRYLWCGSSICQTRNGSDTVLRRDLAEGEYNVSTSQKLIYMPDQLGSVRDVIDGTSGSLVQSYDYTPYGAVARSNGSTPTDYQYARLFAHPASGLNLSATRALDGITGRWLNRDPIREIGGLNMYSYVKANTINWFDPQGLQNYDPKHYSQTWPDWADKTWRDPTVGPPGQSADVRNANVNLICLRKKLLEEALKEVGQDSAKKGINVFHFKWLGTIIERTDIPPQLSVPYTVEQCVDECTTYSYPTGGWGW